MHKIATKQKVYFYLATLFAALFLIISVMPKASAAGEDTIPPDDVENLQVEVYDGAVMLSWDVALDDSGAVAGYNIYSGPEPVTADSGEYSNPVVDAGDKIEFLVEGLTNGETVYFAITAYDEAGNESESYSNEVHGTPDISYGNAPEVGHAAADEQPPTVSDAQALDNETVQVVFSEPIVLPPTDTKSAFTIINNATSEALEIYSVEMDPDDVLGQTLLLTTEMQEGGAEYILTAGIQIEDTAGNPIVSGTSDTAAFIGSTVEPGEDLTGDLPEDDLDAPTVISASALSETSLQIVFSESVILDSDPSVNFFIAQEDDLTNALDILSVERDTSGLIVTITTSLQDAVTYSVVVTDVFDEAGNAIDGTANSTTFSGYVVSEEPIVEEEESVPEPISLFNSVEVTNFLAEIVRDLVVRLSWNAPGDPSITDQVLYKSTDGGTNYDAGTSLGVERETVELTGLKAGIEYYFKLTTKDVAGNESEGMITHIKLPETGMGIGLLIGASAGIAALRRRKK